jgi:hypothetical protein
MTRILAAVAAAVLCGTFSGCQFIPGMGGGAGAYTPTEVVNSLYSGDPADAKEGRWVSYVSETGGNKSTTTIKIVGKDGGNTWVEYWMDLGSMAYGYLLVVDGDRKITKAWAAPKDGKEWKEIKVTEPPKAGSSDAPKPEIKESDERKDVKAGAFSCRRVDVKGSNYSVSTWYSKDVWKLYSGNEHGGTVAMETGATRMGLDGKGEDGKPTIELPKK